MHSMNSPATGRTPKHPEGDDDGHQRKQARTAADRRCGRARETDRQGHRHRRHGRRDPEGGKIALRAGDQCACRHQRQDRRDQAAAADGGGRGTREHRQSDRARGRPRQEPRRPARRFHRRTASAARFRPHRGPVGQAGDRPEGARGRARQAVRGVQGPGRRDRQRHGQARRIRQCHRRSGPRRGHHPARRTDPARALSLRRPRARLHL